MRPLFRTCTFFRDTVLLNSTAVAMFSVLRFPERFPAELERLCGVARRSSRVCLEFDGHWGRGGWRRSSTTRTCWAMAQLGGEQPLACVKEIKLLVGDTMIWAGPVCKVQAA